MSAERIRERGFGQKKQCPYIHEPFEACFCSDMGSQKIRSSLHYCGENFRDCDIYREKNRSGHILIVDDEPTFRYSVADALKQVGYETSEAANGDEAMALLKERIGGNFDLMLVDLQMPGLTGTELICTIREQGMAVPTIAVSDHACRGLIKESLHMGCSDFLYKPLELHELVKRVGNILAKSAGRPAARTV